MERRGFGFRGGSSRFGDRFDKPKPVKEGEEYDITITDVGAKGDGIGKIENFIVFVAGAKKGETCKVKIKEVARKFAIGEKVGAAEAKEDSEEESQEEEAAEEETQEDETEEEDKEE